MIPYRDENDLGLMDGLVNIRAEEQVLAPTLLDDLFQTGLQ
jgi:hypothetical protein